MTEKVSILSFIQLFMIRRILYTKYTNDTHQHLNQEPIENKYIHKHNIIRKIVSELDKTVDQHQAHAIISTLLNNGIKKYMLSTFDTTKQKIIIDKIFNGLLLTKFQQEYQQLYTNNSTSQSKYQSLVFNAADMMCSIFQFLPFGSMHRFYREKDFDMCSLVCSQWLYHAWNPNCIYHCDITRLVLEYQNHTCWKKNLYNNDGSVVDRRYIRKNNFLMQTWERVRFNARSVYMHLTYRNFGHHAYDPTSLLAKQLSMFRNVEKISGFGEYQVLNVLLQTCNHKIKMFDSGYYSTGYKSKIDPIQLSNVHTMVIRGTKLPIIWTNRCHDLIIDIQRSHIMDYKWCSFIIDNCDCGGIKYLKLNAEDFDKQFRSKLKHDYISLLEKFAQKFTNIYKLEIRYLKANMLLLELLCKLQKMISNNNGYIEFNMTINNSNSADMIAALRFIREKNITNINKLIVDNRNTYAFKWHLDLIDWCNLEYAQIKHRQFVIYRINDWTLIQVTQQLNRVFFGHGDAYWQSYFNIQNPTAHLSLKVIDIDCTIIPEQFGFVNDFFTLILKIISKTQICIKTNLSVLMKNYSMESLLLWQFEIFCNNIYELIHTQKALFDVRINFTQCGYDNLYAMKQRYLSIFHQKETMQSNIHSRQNMSSFAKKYCKPYKTHIVFFAMGTFNASNCEIIQL